MLWGEEADFRLFFVHLHWDSWVHERDMLLPLGLPHRPDPESVLFAAAYAVLLAGVAIRMSGGELTTTLSIPDFGNIDLEATPDALRVDIDDDSPAHTGDPVDDVGVLVDALAGRGEVGSAVDAPDDVIDALSSIGAFLRG